MGGALVVMSWVYDQLVENSEDIPGQFAYLYYKSQKREFAELLRASGTADDDIPEKLRAYQKSVAEDNLALTKFKVGGKDKLEKYIEGLETETIAEAEINLKEQYQKKYQCLRRGIADLNAIAEQPPRGRFQRCVSWFFIGVRSWLATAFFGLLLFIAALFLVSKDTKDGVMDEFLSGFVQYIECFKSNPPDTCSK